MLLQSRFLGNYLNARINNPRKDHDCTHSEGRVSAQQPISLSVFLKHTLQLLLHTSLKTFFDVYSKPSM
jgi:hypothetical protein